LPEIVQWKAFALKEIKMADENLHIRLRSGQTEVELEGGRELVEAWFERLKPYFSIEVETSAATSAIQGAILQEDLPTSFGEYLHHFASDITDQDRALIAGSYCQRTSDGNQFTTAEANQLLQEHGVKLSNPSKSLVRNVGARRMFKIGNGAFRVSAEGMQYLSSLGGGEPEPEKLG
jgi:hypothetical protein